LDEARLTYDTITVGGTPRRLTVQVTSLAPAQTPKEFVRRGPPVNRAYDEDGKPTRAAEGFARGQGVAVEDLEKQEIDGGHYVVARVHDEGQPTGDILAEQLPALIMGLRFGRSMQWNSSGVTFSRPIRWVVALLGEAVVPFSYAGVHSGRTTRGTRDADSPLLELENAEAYTAMLEAQGIILNRDTRRENIRQQVEATAEEAGGRVVDDLDLLDEVTNLVEQPTAVLGRFDEGFLDLPDIALMTVMRKHQRYFAVVDDDGNLMPMFVTVRNGGEAHLDKVAHGNEQVIRARFSDARFFFDEDVTQPLEAYLDGLDTLTFQEDLGSYREKAARLEGLSGRIGAMLGLGDEDLQKTIRAARLAKADLTTQMVVEMTSLQGEMGRIYALRGGEDPAVADAIAEHYMPTSTSGEVPPSDIGTAVALADRLDSLVGLFSVGLQPTGTSDPYALRRAALGIVQIALEKELDLSLSQLIKWAAQGYTGELGKEGVGKAAQQEVFTFMLERMRVLFREHFRYDVAEAVLSAAGDNPARAWLHAEQLDAWMQRDEWGYTLDQFARCVRITRSVEEDHTVNPDALTEDIERKLLGGIKKMEAERGAQPDVDSLLAALQPLLPVIETFFAPPDEGGVLVMAEDDAVRANRLGLLQRIARSAEGIADFSQLEGF
jgi:glycyl-tRNA synthetase